MVTTLYLIRHGKTAGGEVKRYHGSIDVPLSDEGEAQMQATAAYLRQRLEGSAASQRMSYLRDIHGGGEAPPGPAGLRQVYCSDLSRAIKSAEYVAAPFGLQPVIVPQLRERSFGIWEGMSFIEIKDRYPEEFEAWAGDPLRFSPPGGENTLEVRDRAIAALDEILSRHPGQEIAVVAHGGVNRVILCHVLGISLENIFRIEQDHAAVSIIEYWEKYPVVKLMNGGRQ